ncbi:LuxR C-terminal-related transcriptional regulator [Falsiroseomonas tokyonensis]|uniref:LuxR C-terminal-related transcriptional regulator n=1 Tax=Falsiroseomonas tokyonensis TaxID=430521 RepID=A0ABV7C180_9PROT|nr:response regulator transcription factor [Falsiroseomonas tokyonensis]MBU8541456.1 response regulator transcription factor [Falsiroseomonas tokyonensis]
MSRREGDGLDASGSIHTIIIDTQRLFRDALRRLLEASSVDVVGEGRDVEEALRSIPTNTSLHLAICSFLSEADALRDLPRAAELRRFHPGLKLVVLADLQQHNILLGSLQAGVEALLSRDISSDVLQRALELVQLGQRVMPAELVQLLRDPACRPTSRTAQQEPAVAASDLSRAASLTPRECQILQCLMDGRSNKEIARDLRLTEATVKAHVKALLRKTHMTNRTQAAIWAITHNFQINDVHAPEPCRVKAQPDFAMPPLHMLPANGSLVGGSLPVEEGVLVRE